MTEQEKIHTLFAEKQPVGPEAVTPSLVDMASAVATIAALREENAIEKMHRRGEALRDGILDQARSWDLAVNYTGPPQAG